MSKTKTLIVFVVFLGLIGCFSCSQSIITEDTFLYPAEFEEHESIWLAWPTYQYEPGYSNEDVVLKIIESLAPYVLVDLMVQDKVEAEKVQAIFKARNFPYDHVRFRFIPREDIWIRDMGPIFLKNGQGKMKIADLGFNTWGYENQTSEYSMVAERVDRLVARELELPVMRSSMIGEGGNREFNGKGTMMVTEAVELQRNPEWTKAELEREYKRIFNIKKVIWLPEGVAEDDFTFKGVLPGKIFVRGTGGHIKDEAFKQVITKVFPNCNIIQINPEAINIGGGGMHCISQQMPAT